MARFRQQKRPDPARLVANRVAAARVQAASAAAAIEEQVAEVAAGVPGDLSLQLDDIRDRLDQLEP